MLPILYGPYTHFHGLFLLNSKRISDFSDTSEIMIDPLLDQIFKLYHKIFIAHHLCYNLSFHDFAFSGRTLVHFIMQNHAKCAWFKPLSWHSYSGKLQNIYCKQIQLQVEWQFTEITLTTRKSQKLLLTWVKPVTYERRNSFDLQQMKLFDFLEYRQFLILCWWDEEMFSVSLSKSYAVTW